MIKEDFMLSMPSICNIMFLLCFLLRQEEDYVIDTTKEGYQVVLPPYYANLLRKSKSEIQR